jgi:outer membrane protein OmpA-like peptidoglycan-associated protein
MGRFGLRAGAFGAVLLGAACAGFDPAPPATPSPRPECAQASVTIYFTEESATLQPLTDPLVGSLMERVNACVAAGGEVREIRILAYPDRGSGRAAAEAEMRARAARVRAALQGAGAPAEKIRVVRPRGDSGAIMRRRAEVTADLW